MMYAFIHICQCVYKQQGASLSLGIQHQSHFYTLRRMQYPKHQSSRPRAAWRTESRCGFCTGAVSRSP